MDISRKAKIKLKNTPAKSTAICCNFVLLTKLLALSGPFIDSSFGSSPKIFTYPPKGIRFSDYVVSPTVFPKSFDCLMSRLYARTKKK